MTSLVSSRIPMARRARALLLLAVSIGYFGYVFQVQSPAFMTSGLSEWLDPYFLNLVAEHWYHSLLTLSDPASPLMIRLPSWLTPSA